MEIEAIREIFKKANIRVNGDTLAVFYHHRSDNQSDTGELEGHGKDALCLILQNSKMMEMEFNSKYFSIIFKLKEGFFSNSQGAIYMRQSLPVTVDYEALWKERFEQGMPPDKAEVFWKHFDGADFEDGEDIRERAKGWFDELLPIQNISAEKLDKWHDLRDLAKAFYARSPRFELEYTEPGDRDSTAFATFGLYETSRPVSITYNHRQIQDILEMLSGSDGVLIDTGSDGVELTFCIHLTEAD